MTCDACGIKPNMTKPILRGPLSSADPNDEEYYARWLCGPPNDQRAAIVLYVPMSLCKQGLTTSMQAWHCALQAEKHMEWRKCKNELVAVYEETGKQRFRGKVKNKIRDKLLNERRKFVETIRGKP